MSNTEKYLKFATNNGYLFDPETQSYTFDDYSDIKWQELIELITSREFLEAICHWLRMEGEHFYSMNELTGEQAIAIRDWKLEEFINNLITCNFYTLSTWMK